MVVVGVIVGVIVRKRKLSERSGQDRVGIDRTSSNQPPPTEPTKKSKKRSSRLLESIQMEIQGQNQTELPIHEKR